MNETANCPHCDQPGIIVGSRRWYSRGWPATCRQCGALAYCRPHGIVTTGRVLFEVIIAPLVSLVLAVLCAVYPSLFVIALVAIGFCFFYLWHQRGRHRPSRPNFTFRLISPESSRLSRRLTYLAIVITLAAFGALFFAVIHQHGQPKLNRPRSIQFHWKKSN